MTILSAKKYLIRSSHLTVPRFRCPCCGVTEDTRVALEYHFRGVDPEHENFLKEFKQGQLYGTYLKMKAISYGANVVSDLAQKSKVLPTDILDQQNQVSNIIGKQAAKMSCYYADIAEVAKNEAERLSNAIVPLVEEYVFLMRDTVSGHAATAHAMAALTLLNSKVARRILDGLPTTVGDFQ